MCVTLQSVVDFIKSMQVTNSQPTMNSKVPQLTNALCYKCCWNCQNFKCKKDADTLGACMRFNDEVDQNNVCPSFCCHPLQKI